ncbi:MAG: FAD-binding protein [Nitrososphaerota archaeon]|nr:FAD-binding protein [Nitrososphaerota archaeon]
MSDATRKTDVVVVGGGLAGLVAGSRAAELGAQVLLLDKGSFLGDGNTQTTTGAYYTAGVRVSSAPGELYARAMRGGAANAELASTWADNCSRALDWLEHVGVEVDNHGDVPLLEPKSAVSTGPVYRVDAGTNIIKKLRAFYESQNGVSMSKTRALKLIASDGRVTGVEAQDSTGARLTVRSGATVLATGGFQANRELLRKHVGKHADSCKLMGSSSATGDGLKMATDVRAKVVNLRYIYARLVSYKAVSDDRFWPYPTFETLLEDGLVVDGKGRRFSDEGWGDVPLANVLAGWDDVTRAWLIFDEAAWERSRTDPSSVVPPNPWLSEKDGGLFKADSLSDLARKLGLDGRGLEQTVERFNAAALRRRLGELEVPRFNNARQIRGPYYGMRLVPGIVSTMGGPLVNKRALVVDRNDRPIPGLFAAGDVVGGLMGGRTGGYVGGISQAAVTGLIAGEGARKLAMASIP